MAIGSCSKISAGLDIGCLNATAKMGGLVSRMYIANFDDIASYTQDATSKVIDTLVMESGKKFYRFVSAPEKHSVKYTSGTSSNFAPWKVDLEGQFYTESTLNDEKIDALKDGGRYVVVIEYNAGFMKVLGIDIASGTVSDPEGGLAWEGGEGGSGIMKTDDTAFKIKLGGYSSHIPKRFLPTGGTLSAAITYMEGLAT